MAGNNPTGANRYQLGPHGDLPAVRAFSYLEVHMSILGAIVGILIIAVCMIVVVAAAVSVVLYMLDDVRRDHGGKKPRR